MKDLHRDVADFPFLNPGSTDLDHHIGKSFYFRREPGSNPYDPEDRYIIQVGKDHVQRRVEYVGSKDEPVFLNRAEVYKAGSVQRIWNGDLALRIYAPNDSFGRPALLEDLIPALTLV